MRKLQCILGFFLLSSQIWGQIVKRTFYEPDVETLIAVDSIRPNQWKFTFRNTSGGQHSASYFYQAIYYRDIDSLGPLKRVKFITSETRVQLPHLRINDYQSFHLYFDNTYPFIGATWIDLKSEQEDDKAPFFDPMSASLNWQHQQDSVFALFGTKNYNQWSPNRIGSDTLILAHIEKETKELQLLDTFLLEIPILSPGVFLMPSNAQQFEYINDSLHYHFKRGNRAADNFYVDTGAYYEGPKYDDSRYSSFMLNYRTLLYYHQGKTREVLDSLGADLLVVETLQDGSEIVQKEIYLPPSRAYADGNFFYQIQKGNTCSYAFYNEGLNHFDLYRMEGDQLISQQTYDLPAGSDFQNWEVHSFADGSFLLLGEIERGFSPGFDDWSKAHYIYIGPNGNQVKPDNEAFTVHYDDQASSLQVFNVAGDRSLEYRIIDASGRAFLEGNFKTSELIMLGDWRTGIYYLQLWEPSGDYLGQSSFLKD